MLTLCKVINSTNKQRCINNKNVVILKIIHNIEANVELDILFGVKALMRTQ